MIITIFLNSLTPSTLEISTSRLILDGSMSKVLVIMGGVVLVEVVN